MYILMLDPRVPHRVVNKASSMVVIVTVTLQGRTPKIFVKRTILSFFPYDANIIYCFMDLISK